MKFKKAAVKIDSRLLVIQHVIHSFHSIIHRSFGTFHRSKKGFSWVLEMKCNFLKEFVSKL